MNKTILLLSATALVATAQADTVTFENDPSNWVGNGFVSVDSPNVSFYDTLGSDLLVYYTPTEANGQAIGAFYDDTSALRMLFTQDYSTLSLRFGNDNAGWIDANDFALLSLYNDGNFVGSAAVNPNVNDAGDQFVTWTGGAFDEAIFQYVDQDLNPIGLIEVVDDITFGDGQQPVPEVQHYATMLGGLLVGAQALRRRMRK